jgi:hypothetical protein
LQAVLGAELAQRRSEVVGIDPRLGDSVDLLIGFVMRGGKRLRPEFLWCGWLAAGGSDDDTSETDAIYRVGAALELIQACALIHDDVIDRSDSRRGRPSTHRAVAKVHADAGLTGDAEHYGVSAAILLGDLALAWADDLVIEGAHSLGAVDRALPVWRAMRTEVLSGQLLDLLVTASTTTDPAQQEVDALRINRYKTAAYTVERPLQLGAALADGTAATIAALRSTRPGVPSERSNAGYSVAGWFTMPAVDRIANDCSRVCSAFFGENASIEGGTIQTRSRSSSRSSTAARARASTMRAGAPATTSNTSRRTRVPTPSPSASASCGGNSIGSSRPLRSCRRA